MNKFEDFLAQLKKFLQSPQTVMSQAANGGQPVQQPPQISNNPNNDFSREQALRQAIQAGVLPPTAMTEFLQERERQKARGGR